MSDTRRTAAERVLRDHLSDEVTWLAEDYREVANEVVVAVDRAANADPQPEAGREALVAQMAADGRIPGGPIRSLADEVRDFLAAAEDGGLKMATRPPNAHGGAYMSRWRFERLRTALAARSEGERIHEMTALAVKAHAQLNPDVNPDPADAANMAREIVWRIIMLGERATPTDEGRD